MKEKLEIIGYYLGAMILNGIQLMVPFLILMLIIEMIKGC